LRRLAGSVNSFGPPPSTTGCTAGRGTRRSGRIRFSEKLQRRPPRRVQQHVAAFFRLQGGDLTLQVGRRLTRLVQSSPRVAAERRKTIFGVGPPETGRRPPRCGSSDIDSGLFRPGSRPSSPHRAAPEQQGLSTRWSRLSELRGQLGPPSTASRTLHSGPAMCSRSTDAWHPVDDLPHGRLPSLLPCFSL